MMKKVLCVILLISLLIPAAAGLCDTTQFTVALTPLLTSDNTEEILSESISRSFLTVCLWIDLAITNEKGFMSENIVDILFNDSYISSDGQYIALLAYSKDKYLNIYYDPATKTANYSILDNDGATEAAMAAVIKTIAESMAYNYKNDPAELQAVFQVISEALQGE